MIRKSSAIRSLTAAATLALGLATAFGACATDAPAPATSSQTAAKSGHVPLLWKISDKDNTLYLLGSHHLLRSGDLPLSADVDAAYRDARTTMFELDILGLKAPEQLAKIQAYQVLAGDRTMSQLLPDDTRKKLESLLKLSGGSMAQVDRTDVWALSMGMSVGAMMAMGFSGDNGPDQLLSVLSDKDGKPRIALETVDDEFSALDRTPEGEQIAGLDKFVSDPAGEIKKGLRLHDAWMAGDADTLTRDYLQQMQAEAPQSYRLLLADRNNAWLPRLRERLDAHGAGDNTLAVVGALHLLGKDGLIEQLRAAGYRVERVCSDCAR